MWENVKTLISFDDFFLKKKNIYIYIYIALNLN